MRTYGALFLLLVPATAWAQVPKLTITRASLQEAIDGIREKSRVPAIGAAIVTSEGVHAIAVTGVRKLGTKVKVAEDDLWHIGSDSKAFTATMLMVLAEKKLIDLDATLEDTFPKLKRRMNEKYRKVTLDQVLRHKGGLVDNLPGRWRGINQTMSLPAQRQQAVRIGLGLKPAAEPGEKAAYSNLGFVLATAAAEERTKKPYEVLVRERVFAPLGIKDAGFGPAGTPGRLDQPLLHDKRGVSREPLAVNDNPAVMTPSTRLHMSLRSWGLFVQDQLLGARGKGKLLSSEGYKKLHTAAKGDLYGPGGWAVEANAEVGAYLSHDGSNGGNYVRAIILPKIDVAILIVTNIGPDPGKNAVQASTLAIMPRLFAKPGK